MDHEGKGGRAAVGPPQPPLRLIASDLRVGGGTAFLPVQPAYMALRYCFLRSSGCIIISSSLCGSGPTGIAGVMPEDLSHLRYLRFYSLDSPLASPITAVPIAGKIAQRLTSRIDLRKSSVTRYERRTYHFISIFRVFIILL